MPLHRTLYIKLNPVLSKPKGIKRKWSWLEVVWAEEIPKAWAIMFTFGESFDNGLYYSFASNPNYDNNQSRMEFSIAERNKIE